jgi:selenocysteine lyase/cysteine desulfurase
MPTLAAPTSHAALASPQEREAHFAPFRDRTIGTGERVSTPYGSKPLVYADWIASGRLYEPIERRMAEVVAPWVGNTHTETSVTGTAMTQAYHYAHHVIKRHVNAAHQDVLLTCGTGMTGAICKFQRILGLRVPDAALERVEITERNRPVVFVTHMEHHSNQTSWLETLAEVVVMPAGDDGYVDPGLLDELLERYRDRPLKIGSFTSGSNVTGILTPYHDLARVMHRHGGVCFVDFAATAPYVDIDMHPEGDPEARLDAVFFSPHKFLGGPGSSGVLLFDSSLYRSRVPDDPGGGTVAWTNPWGGHRFTDDIEAREDGGTPGFLQAIRAALAVRLKEAMTTEAMHARERDLLRSAFARLRAAPGLNILADPGPGAPLDDRIGVLSFYLDGVHYNLVVKLLNDRFGVQVRGGCSCAGTYGHILLGVNEEASRILTDRIDAGDLSCKPGWVRLSLHPTLSDEELDYVLTAIEAVAANAAEWQRDYDYDPSCNEWRHRAEPSSLTFGPDIQAWFDSVE